MGVFGCWRTARAHGVGWPGFPHVIVDIQVFKLGIWIQSYA